MGDPAGEDVGAEILPGGGPAELVGQPGEEPPVDGGVVRLRSVAFAPAAALDPPLLEGLGVALDGAAADSEPLREGGVGDPGFVLPGLGDGVSAFGRVGWMAGSGQAGRAIRHAV